VSWLKLLDTSSNWLELPKSRFKLPKMFKEVGLNPNNKQAVVVAHNFQNQKKLENFCIYHDFSVKFFTNAQKAKQWLLVQ